MENSKECAVIWDSRLEFVRAGRHVATRRDIARCRAEGVDGEQVANIATPATPLIILFQQEENMYA